jgi:hypothetical protein
MFTAMALGIDHAGDFVADGLLDAFTDGQYGDHSRDADDDAEHGEEAAHFGIANAYESHLEIF